MGFSLWAGSRSDAPSLRELIVSFLVVVWALRLSSFRIFVFSEPEKTGVLTNSKHRPSDFSCRGRFGLWVFLTAIVLVINSQAGPAPELGVWDAVGLSVWCVGFGVEVVADNQKSAFNREPMNEGKWIDRFVVVFKASELPGKSLFGRNRLLWNLLLFRPLNDRRSRRCLFSSS